MELDLSRQTLADLKANAKELRNAEQAAGHHITHAEALERIAKRHGARDWNTLYARVSKPIRLGLGDRIRGRYMSQPFQGRVHAIEVADGAERMRLTLQFDTPVDVVKFDSFSSFRHRVSATIGRTGRSVDQTSDGQPHLIVAPIYN